MSVRFKAQQVISKWQKTLEASWEHFLRGWYHKWELDGSLETIEDEYVANLQTCAFKNLLIDWNNTLT